MVGGTVLLVEHETPGRAYLEQQLADDGFDVLGTDRCTAALKLAEQAKPSLVLLDASSLYGCPEEMVGARTRREFTSTSRRPARAVRTGRHAGAACPLKAFASLDDVPVRELEATAEVLERRRDSLGKFSSIFREVAWARENHAEPRSPSFTFATTSPMQMSSSPRRSPMRQRPSGAMCVRRWLTGIRNSRRRPRRLLGLCP